MSTTARRKRPRDPRKAGAGRDIGKPFDATLLARAREIAADYQVVMWSEGADYVGRGVELPMTFGDGRTPDQCMKQTREALAVTVAYMLEQGETPPPPASGERRTEQISVRVGAEEKLRLETLARQHGFKGVGDDLRARGLARAG
jgi:predicted RNase H-like HicB family nuclease